ncbi:DUF2975 domain-containing protein [Allosphingosinicella deserti]|uniref:DUF2975 domain-containing protein n=1 Tax=Allosphingosinicella deserti TaxID=2116704 RepID=A0A2P7QSD9_9SPHN|nr:DUF2975 domain-containing protein [Sphingomonas deserti]PSJ40882.1 hypothetical protein C7I55_11445 [Sphingomonas deserti]
MVVSESRAMKAVITLLRVLIILNLVAAGFFLLLLVGSYADIVQTKIQQSGADVSPAALLASVRLVMTIGLLSVPFAHVLLIRLKAIVGTVQAGDPFVADNAGHLKTIAWTLLALQLLDVGFGFASAIAEEPFGWTFSLTGWLAVILLFVLARVFDHGTRMREELAGTV